MRTEPLKERIQKELSNLRTLRDEIRVDLHLAGMEARKRWADFEPRIAEAEKLADDVSETSRQAIARIAERVREFHRSLKH